MSSIEDPRRRATLIASPQPADVWRIDIRLQRGALAIAASSIERDIAQPLPLPEVRDGFNARRRVSLRIQGRRDLPLTRVGEPLPLSQLEQDGAELARFLGVNLEGL